jgi:hypothetical protein
MAMFTLRGATNASKGCHAHVRAGRIGEHLRGEGERLSGLFSYNNSNLLNALLSH